MTQTPEDDQSKYEPVNWPVLIAAILAAAGISLTAIYALVIR